MNRRNFLVNTGIVGAGLLGAGNAASGFLRADTANNSDSNLTLEEKPVAFTVPPLPYSFDALEPYIDAKTMEIHHDKHHGAYVTNVNKALEGQADRRFAQRSRLGAGKYPQRCPQQRRRPLEPLPVLDPDEKGRWGRAKGESCGGNQLGVWVIFWISGKVCSRGTGPLWFRMGLA